MLSGCHCSHAISGGRSRGVGCVHIHTYIYLNILSHVLILVPPCPQFRFLVFVTPFSNRRNLAHIFHRILRYCLIPLCVTGLPTLAAAFLSGHPSSDNCLAQRPAAPDNHYVSLTSIEEGTLVVFQWNVSAIQEGRERRRN